MATPVAPNPQNLERIYITELREKNGPNYQLANIIDMQVKTSFIAKESFVKELLQNANDQAIESVEVSFVLVGNELIVSHDGKPFSKEDVRKICDYADSDNNDKGIDAEKAGYKDIGFKSIFGPAWKVAVLSKEWRFHFDETKCPSDGKKYAWQIAPHWTEDHDLSTEAKKLTAENEKTHFICQLRHATEVAASIQAFVEQPDNILFLNKTRKISFSINGKTTELINSLSKQWRCLDCSASIPVAVRQFMLSPESASPRRLKGKDRVSFTICYRQVEEGLVPVSNGKLFSTLATGGDSGLPFHVNAPFLLNPSREALLDNVWNTFLLEEIARRHFAHVKEFFGQSRRTALSLLALTPLPHSMIHERVRLYFETTLQQLILGEPFLPPHSDKRLLRIGTGPDQGIVDPTGFYRSLSFLPRDNLIHVDVDPQQLLARFPQQIKAISLQDILQNLPAIMQQRQIPLCLKIMTYLSTIFRPQFPISQYDWQLLLRQPFVLNSRLEPCAIQSLYLPAGTIPSPEAVHPPILHPELATPEILAWLRELNCPSLTPDQIIQFYQKHLHDESLKQKDRNIKTIVFLFELFKNNIIDVRKLHQLRGFWLLAKSPHVVDSNATYLSQCYQPQLNLEEHFKDPCYDVLFLSEDYIKQHPADPAKWREFFIGLGVKDSCEVIRYSEVSPLELQQIPQAFIPQYIADIFSNAQKPIKNRDAPIAEDTLHSFFGFPYLELVARSRSFALYFWQKLQSYQEIILKQYGNTIYHAYRTPNTQPCQPHTYLQYVFQNHALIPSTDGHHYRSRDLYAPSMQLDILPNVRKAVLPVALKPEMEAFIGFKTILDASDCQNLLQGLLNRFDLRIYSLVMRQILSNLQKHDPSTLALIPNWPFMATNEEWHMRAGLKLWAVPNSEPPESAMWIKNVLRSDKEMAEFCRLACIEIVTTYQEQDQYTGAVPCDTIKQYLMQKIPQIAFRLGKDRRKTTPADAQMIVDDLYERLASLAIYLAPDPADGRAGRMHLENNKLYCFSNWEKQLDVLGQLLREEHMGLESACEKSSFSSALTHDSKPRNPADTVFLQACQRAYENRAAGIVIAVPNAPLPAPIALPAQEAPPPAPPVGIAPQTPPRTTSDNAHKQWLPATPPTALPNPSPPKPLTTPSPNPKTPSATPSPSGGKKATKSAEEILSKKDKKEVGQWAEGYFVDWYIKRKISNKVVKNGFQEAPANILGMRALKGTQKTIEVLWLNAPARRPPEHANDSLWDSGQDHDIEIRTLSPTKTKVRHIEIKGTRANQVHFFISENERKAMLQPVTSERNDYRLFVITKVGGKIIGDKMVEPDVIPVRDLNQLRLIRAKYEYSG